MSLISQRTNPWCKAQDYYQQCQNVILTNIEAKTCDHPALGSGLWHPRGHQSVNNSREMAPAGSVSVAASVFSLRSPSGTGLLPWSSLHGTGPPSCYCLAVLCHRSSTCSTTVSGQLAPQRRSSSPADQFSAVIVSVICANRDRDTISASVWL